MAVPLEQLTHPPQVERRKASGAGDGLRKVAGQAILDPLAPLGGFDLGTDLGAQFPVEVDQSRINPLQRVQPGALDPSIDLRERLFDVRARAGRRDAGASRRRFPLCHWGLRKGTMPRSAAHGKHRPAGCRGSTDMKERQLVMRLPFSSMS